VDTLNIVTPGTPSESGAPRGFATPGPALREAKLVGEAYGGPEGGFGEVKAWYSRWQKKLSVRKKTRRRSVLEERERDRRVLFLVRMIAVL